MKAQDSTDRESIDRKTSRSICDAVGERLQQNLSPQFMGPAPELDRLLNEFRRRDPETNENPASPSGRRYGSFF